MQIPEALTFDDVLLRPAASSVLPNATDTRTRLTPMAARLLGLLIRIAR